MHLKHLLDDKIIELNNVEGRLIATQRLVKKLNDQLNDEKTKHNEPEIENRRLECQRGEAKVRLDHDCQDQERLKAELDQTKADIEQHKQCADGWQRIAVAELNKHAPEVIGQVREISIAKLQEKLDKADARANELVEYNRDLEIHLNDVEYELGINERRLTLDESIKIDFHERKWMTVKEVFGENKLKTAMINGLEARFSEELMKNPIDTPTISTETFEDYAGPEFFDRTNALYRFADEAREGRGENDLRRSDLDKERFTAIHGHGPAGYKPRPQKEMPEGYPERKAARDIANLRWQVKDLRGWLWRFERDADNSPVEEGEWETEGEVEEDIAEWEMDAEAMRRVGFLCSV